MEQRVVCAAIRNTEGLIICGARHFDGVMCQSTVNPVTDEVYPEWKCPVEQGFIDQRGNFLSRTEAWKVAKLAGQIHRRCGGDTANGGTLYSENLY